MKIEDVTDWNKQWTDVEFYDKIIIVDTIGVGSFLAISALNKNSYIVFADDLLTMLPAMDGNNYISSTFVINNFAGELGIKLKNPYLKHKEYYFSRKNPIPTIL